MEPASAVAVICAVVAICAAAFHGWIFHLRSRDQEHLWLAVAALGVAAMGLGTAQLYGSIDPVRSEMVQRLMLATAAPIAIGFFRFSFRLLHVAEMPVFDRQVIHL